MTVGCYPEAAMGLSQDQIRDHIASVEKRLSSDKEVSI